MTGCLTYLLTSFLSAMFIALICAGILFVFGVDDFALMFRGFTLGLFVLGLTIDALSHE